MFLFKERGVGEDGDSGEWRGGSKGRDFIPFTLDVSNTSGRSGDSCSMLTKCIQFSQNTIEKNPEFESKIT